VRDGQDPAAVVTLRIVEHLQLARSKAADVRLDTQRPIDGVGQPLPFMKEGAW
jgi:hypothetical protein